MTTPTLFPIPLENPGRLAITARPRGHDWLPDEVASWKRAGVTLVVSLLTPDEETDLGLTEEAAECTAAGLQFISLPVPDRGVPANRVEFERVVSEVVGELNRDGLVAVHCRQGIGRSAVVVIGVLKQLGVPTTEAIARVSAGCRCRKRRNRPSGWQGIKPHPPSPSPRWRGGVQSANRSDLSSRLTRSEESNYDIPLNTPSPRWRGGRG